MSSKSVVARPVRRVLLVTALVVAATSVASSTQLTGIASVAGVTSAAALDPVPYVPDFTKAPYNGQPISHGLGPTYGESWCANAAPTTSIANQQTAPLALVPYEAFGCLLAQFQAEAVTAGVPARMTYSLIGQSDAGRNQYGVVVNALETPEQVTAYNNWLAYRALALTDPVAAETLLTSFGQNVKIPVFVENNIHGDEEEGADSMMQIIRDLTTTPRGVHAGVDNFLDHAILVTIPNMNPDGRFLGTRANANGYDMNRDWLVQSQPEVRNNIALQQQWLAPVMLATHGYVNPSLIDGLTKPHNPGLEYDIFLKWNQLRLDANQAALARINQGITRPVNGPLPVTVDKLNFISAATSVGTTATITTLSAHGLIVGSTITVDGVAEAGYNGPITVTSVPTATTFTYETAASGLPASSGGTAGTISTTTLNRGFCANGGSPANNICATYTIAPTGLTQVGNTVTVTTTGNTVIKVADTVVIAGAADLGYNGGPFRVDTVISPTQFTYDAPTAGLAPSGTGTAAVQTGPNQAEGWDDLGPFYTQTYSAFFGVDGSTLEMCSSCNAPFTGRLGSKTAQYVGFWSSADFWVANRTEMLTDQVEMFVRGVNDAPRPNCCDDPMIASRGFTEAEHNWMEDYPKAFIIPVNGGGQRSDAEANRLAQWMLDNGITLEKTTADFTWGATLYPAGSYVVPMDQPMRGLAFTALSAGIDYSVRISQLYAAPGAWSHGLMWGADTIEVPNGDGTFTPPTTVITSVNALTGGVAPGASDWYSVTAKGVKEQQAILGLLRDGIFGEMAEEPFVSTSGGPMPAGTVIFANDPTTVAALDAAGAAAGITFERNAAVPKPTTTRLTEAPKIAILANANASGVFSNNDTSTALKVIFGADVNFVSLTGGPNSLQNAAVDPLLEYDVIYNSGQGYPSTIRAAGATSTGTTAIVTTTAAHNLAVGSSVTVAGASDAGYNGTVTVVNVPTTTTFTYNISAPLPSANGGTVTRLSVPITPTGATSTATSATITTAANSSVTVGSTVTISGVGVAGYNGTFTVTAVSGTSVSYAVAGPLGASGGGSLTYAVSPAASSIVGPSATSVGTTATITTAAAHGLTVGTIITISGVAEAGYNGTVTIASVPTTTTFTYVTAGSGLPPSAGGAWDSVARTRLNAFFARGGGYIATNNAATLSFLTASVPALTTGTFTSTNAGGSGGTAVWSNTGGAASPLTGAFPGTDYFYLPSSITYLNSIPTGAVVDGQYLPNMVDSDVNGPSDGWIAGLWRNRTSVAAIATNNAPVLVHGTTSVNSRYTAIGTAPFSRSDFERIWGWVVQSALWGNLTDEAKLDQTITASPITDKVFGDADFPITATTTWTGHDVSLAATGDCTLSAPVSPATVHITGAGSCTITASQAGDDLYNAAPDVAQTITIAKAAQTITFDQPTSPSAFGASFTVAPTADSGLEVTLVAGGGCTNTGFTVTMTSSTVDCTLTASQAGDDDHEAAADVVRTVSTAQAAQTITFDQPAPAVVGSSFTVAPTASSGLVVTLVATGGCTSSGYSVTMTNGSVDCTLTASQAGNGDYLAAADVVRTVTTGKAAQTITFAQPTSPAAVGTSFTVAPTASSGLTVTLVASGGCTSASYTVTMTSGSIACTLTASQAGNDNYLAAPNVVRTVSANRSVSVNDVAVVEGQSGTKTVNFTVSLSSRTASTVTVAYATENGSATAPADYLSRTGSVTIYGGQVSRSVSITVRGDTLNEGDETFGLRLTGVTGPASITDDLGQATIIDNDAPPVLSVGDVSVVEGQFGTKTVNATVTFDHAAPTAGSFKWNTVNGTAVAPGDYTAQNLTTVYYPAGATSRTLTVTVRGDTVIEPNETIGIVLSAPVGATIGNGLGTVTIIDNDTPPVLSVGDASVVEGQSGTKTVTVTVTLDHAAPSAGSFKWNTVNGTAVAPGDYTAKALTTVYFPAGATSRTLVITIRGDRSREANETLSVQLSAPVGATIGDGQATVTIFNND